MMISPPSSTSSSSTAQPPPPPLSTSSATTLPPAIVASTSLSTPNTTSSTSSSSNPSSTVLPRSGSGGGLLHEREVVRRAGKDAISSFLDSHSCYSVLRASGKVVVFDTRIPIQLAFYALVEHDMQCAPLWEAATCQFVGLLTVTDFIDVLRYYRRTRTQVSTLATRSIAEILSDASITNTVLRRYVPRRGKGTFSLDTSADPFQGVLQSSPSSSSSCSSPSLSNTTTTSTATHRSKGFIANPHHIFYSADANTTLKQACRLLHQYSLDYLAILYPADMRVLSTITYTTMLEHLVTHFREQRRLFDDTVYDLGIGTYHEHVITISLHQTVEEALHTMQMHGLSSLPVIDPVTWKIKGVYSRSDITFLASAADAEDALQNLDMTLEALLAQQRTDVTTPDALHTCTTQHTLQSIFEYFAHWKFNRLIVIDEEERVKGVVSARDLVAYFLEDS